MSPPTPTTSIRRNESAEDSITVPQTPDPIPSTAGPRPRGDVPPLPPWTELHGRRARHHASLRLLLL